MVPRKLAGIQSTASVLVLALFIAYCMPDSALAQTAPAQTTNSQIQANSPADPVAPAGQQPATNQASQPSQGSNGAAQSVPQPVTTYPDATAASSPDAPQPKTQPQANQVQNEPQGAATAEKVNAAGGAAAKPAGVAIAPAKQHQARSLLIKVGAVIAAGAAAGTVYALSRGTSSIPPGANGPGVTQKR